MEFWNGQIKIVRYPVNGSGTASYMFWNTKLKVF